MNEDIRSMLTNRAKVSPRNSVLKLGTTKFNEEEIAEIGSSDTQELIESQSLLEEISANNLPSNIELASADLKAGETKQSSDLAKSVGTGQKKNFSTPHQNKQEEKASKKARQQPTSIKEAVENDSDSVAISINQSISSKDKNTTIPSSDLQKIEAELEKLPQIGKRLAIHLEQQVRADLLSLCDRQEITPEVFLEATFVILQNQGSLLEEIVTDAKERLAARKKAGFLRRTISMIGKIG
jgi:hypothetical protein